jgi:hypothetical protein
MKSIDLNKVNNSIHSLTSKSFLEIVNHQSIVNENEENIRLLNERLQLQNDQHQIQINQSNEQIVQLQNEKTQFLQQLQNIDQSINENEQLKDKITQVINSFH